MRNKLVFLVFACLGLLLSACTNCYVRAEREREAMRDRTFYPDTYCDCMPDSIYESFHKDWPSIGMISCGFATYNGRVDTARLYIDYIADNPPDAETERRLNEITKCCVNVILRLKIGKKYRDEYGDGDSSSWMQELRVNGRGPIFEVNYESYTAFFSGLAPAWVVREYIRGHFRKNGMPMYP